jgi:hypothetical protein
MASKSLSSRAVKQMLSREGLDWRKLRISERQTTSRDAWNGGPWETYTEVRIEGPKEIYDRAYWALFTKGLSVAGYPGYSFWCRQNRKSA